ncbi:hypothetical protein K438DRAFT_657184 [Mycena galopus ATCC 62051]|nr:hypothetical protein K438DRAFT_657184 [Mycena galopus ATCC 62051]
MKLKVIFCPRSRASMADQHQTRTRPCLSSQCEPSQHIPEESTYPDPLKWDEPNPLLDPSIQCPRFTPLLLPSPLILVTSSVSPVCNPAI